MRSASTAEQKRRGRLVPSRCTRFTAFIAPRHHSRCFRSQARGQLAGLEEQTEAGGAVPSVDPRATDTTDARQKSTGRVAGAGVTRTLAQHLQEGHLSDREWHR